MSSVLAGFLVRLGFVVDNDQQAKFQATIDNAGKRMKEIAVRGAAMGTAFAASFAKSTQEINRFYNLSNQTGASVRSINNISSALKKVGGSAEAAQSAMQSLSDKLIRFPALEDQLKRMTGMTDIKDSNGYVKYEEILLRLRDRWKDMPEAVAQNEAALLGLEGIYSSLMKQDFPAELEKTSKQQGELTDMIDKSADSAHRLANEFSNTWEIISNGAKAAAGQLIEAIGLDKELAKVNDKLSKGLPEVLKTEKYIWDKSKNPVDWAYNMLFKADDLHEDRLYEEHKLSDEEVQKRLRKKYTKILPVLSDEAEEGVDNIEYFDQKGYEDELAKYRSSQKDKQMTTLPATQSTQQEVPEKMTRGLRNNNPGNLRPTSMNSPQNGGFQVFPSREAGWGALGRQLKGYANAGLENIYSIISKYAPSTENDTAAYINAVAGSMSQRLGTVVTPDARLDLKDARVLKALMMAITDHENFKGASRYFEGPSFDREVGAASQSEWKSKVVSDRDKFASNGQVTVNQNITINGADNPTAVGKAVAKETLLAQNRYGTRNIS
ncbi:hypothetical protein [Turicimonas muris]|uniref:hypothetical protein n=1 Tax=Turicimonas muris TaxID=1796652 RepID=UPI0025733842|nr:hypothetical protein [Turicimonas muris]